MKNKNLKTSQTPVVKAKTKPISHKQKAINDPTKGNGIKEYIPNAHLPVNELENVDRNPTLSEEELVVIPIYTPQFEEERIETLPNINATNEENSSNYNTISEEPTPVESIENFVMQNFKEHLVERNLFISLLEVITEAKKQEQELLNS